MGEHKLKDKARGLGSNGRAALGLVGANGQPFRKPSVVREAPKVQLRLIATAAEVGAASFLVDFALTLGISRFNAQTAAIAFTTKVPLRELVGKVVEVVRVLDGTRIPQRLVDPSLPMPGSELEVNVEPGATKAS